MYYRAANAAPTVRRLAVPVLTRVNTRGNCAGSDLLLHDRSGIHREVWLQIVLYIYLSPAHRSAGRTTGDLLPKI